MPISSEILYSSIDQLPIYNWIQVHEKGDFALLVKTPGKIKASPEEIGERWLALNNEHLKVFGMSAAFRQYMEDVKKITVMICDHAIKPDPAKHIRIQLLEDKLRKYTDKTQAVNFYKTTAFLNKFVGYHIDVTKMSVSEYYHNLRMYEEAVKQQQAEHRKHGKKDKL